MQSYQQNNFSPMGQGQPTSGKDAKKKNFMNDVVGLQPMAPPESVAPGIPQPMMGGAMSAAVPQSVDRSNMAPAVPSNQPVSRPMQASQAPALPPQTAGVPGSYMNRIVGNYQPTQNMQGFDFSREQNIGKSAKDAFAYFAQQAAAAGKPAPLQDASPEAKANYGNWFNQNIRQQMQNEGHNITDVQGDKFRFNNWQGDYWVDFGGNAGAQNGALTWQAENANGPSGPPRTAPANDIYAQAQAAMMAPPEAPSSLESILQALMSQNEELI